MSIHMIAYDTINYIYMCSKADEMASLIQCTAQKRETRLWFACDVGRYINSFWLIDWLIDKEKQKNRRNGPGKRPWRQSGRKKWNYGKGVGFGEHVVFEPGVKRKGVMDQQSGESKEEKVMGEGIGKTEIEELVPERGWQKDKGSWYQRQGEA